MTGGPLAPLETLFTTARGAAAPLPAALAALYGPLDLATPAGRPLILGNFVATLDGVVALNTPGVPGGGGEISGFNQSDRLVMGLLRAVVDAVVVGAGTLRSVPRHRWTPAYIYPPLAEEYRALRATLGLEREPLTVIVSGSGDLDLSLPVFTTPEAAALIVTTASGAERLAEKSLPPSTHLRAAEGSASIRAGAVLAALLEERPCARILTEGGPALMADILAEGLLDELYLTLAPQVAGRDASRYRPGFAEGALFAPERPLWGTLLDARRAGSHLFLRYGFDGDGRRAEV